MSTQQQAAMAALKSGPLNTVELAARIALGFESASWMLNALRDRGYVACSRTRAAGRYRFTWRLTTAGERAIANS